ncbi:hypothetical protein ABZY93_22305 [Streptomyces smyrnaeus]|uniref:hypothetical protein n=1 Tax=Streptomyces smyrnaeus TaxID=1387713 RepID=UPI0033A7110A
MIDVAVTDVNENAIELEVTGPANERNRGAHAADRTARELSRTVFGFSIHRQYQNWRFKEGAYTFTARYSTTL